MEVVVQEKVQALVHEEVASALDALALIVHASALELSWKTTDDVRSLRDVLWKRTYGYETRTIETAVLRLGSHAVVLATEISVRINLTFRVINNGILAPRGKCRWTSISQQSFSPCVPPT